MRKIRVGSRESKLAVIQSNLIINEIKKYHNNLEFELVTMKTTGDIILNKRLDKIGGKGLFVKEIDKALIEDKIDISVHSLKDMPMEISEDIPITAFSKRENPKDVLVLPDNINSFDENGIIGSSSERRILQLKQIFKKAEFKNIRGNVITRLEKLNKENYDCIVLAYAGLKRLNIGNKISRIFSTDEIIPAAGQGIIAVQARKDFDCSFLECINNKKSEYEALSERAFIKTIGGGCSSPSAAHAIVKGNEIKISGIYFDENKKVFFKDFMVGNINEAEKIGTILAENLIGRCN